MAARYLTLILLLSPTVSLAMQSVPAGYQQVAREMRIPAELLYAVALTESGARLSQDIYPWPWTLNVGGRAWRYTSKQQACTALMQFLHTRNPHTIDAGLGQINIGWNGQHFATPCEALEPYRNLSVTARLLRGWFESERSWLAAAGKYHHPAGGIVALRYRQKVARYLQHLAL